MPNASEWLKLNFSTPTEGHKSLLDAVQKWLGDVLSGGMPRWISLLGPSNTGKTFLAKQVWRIAVQAGKHDSAKARHSPSFVRWQPLIDDMRSGDRYDEVRDMANWPLLVLDDVFAERDKEGFAADKLNTLLAQRDGKWTLITSNLSLETISRVDSRVASRLTRNRAEAWEITFPDWNTYA